MAFLIAGAAVFAAGGLFGAWMVLTGQQSKTNQARQRVQDAILKDLEGKSNGPKNR